jgi:hypothetical protein
MVYNAEEMLTDDNDGGDGMVAIGMVEDDTDDVEQRQVWTWLDKCMAKMGPIQSTLIL